MLMISGLAVEIFTDSPIKNPNLWAMAFMSFVAPNFQLP